MNYSQKKFKKQNSKDQNQLINNLNEVQSTDAGVSLAEK